MVKNKEDNTDLVIPAGIFLGWGLGILIGHWLAGFFIGLGAGFLVLAMSHLIFRKR
jgi:hypothetical protein